MRRGTEFVVAALIFLIALLTVAETAPSTQREASALLARSLATTQQRLGPMAPELLPILAPLAQLRFEQAEFTEATALRRRSLKIAIAAYGVGSAPAAEAMAALARLYIELRRYLDAEPLAIAATNILRERLGASDPALAAVLADRARIALARGKDKQAQKWVEEAIAIDRESGGAAHGDRLRVLGAVRTAEGKYDDGEQALRQALALDRAKGDKLATARGLALLAHADLPQKRFAAALPRIEEAALIDQTCLAPTHPLIAEDFHDLGLVYLATERPADAAKAFRMAIDVLDRGAGRDTPTQAYIMLDLARAEHALGREQEAQSLFSAARHMLNAAEDEERGRQSKA